MPYKKVERQPLRKLLNSHKISSGRELARKLGVSNNAGQRRFKDLGLLTVADLERLNSHGHIPIDEIREAIGKR